MRQTERIALVNGRVHTPSGLVDSIMLDSGRIAAVGAIPNMRFRDGARVFDLHGRTVLPGFCDSHVHLLRWAQTREQISLEGCRSVEELCTALRAFAADHPAPAGGWYQGYGWDLEGDAEPTRQDIDEALPGVPAILWRSCGHVAVVNTAAIEIAGITRDTRARSGAIQTGPDGEPDGILKEGAVSLVSRFLPRPGDEDLSRLLKKYGPLIAACGLTELCSDDLEIFGADFRRSQDFFMDAALSGALPFRLRRQLRLPSGELLPDLLADGWRSGDGIPFCQVGPLKLVCDGSVGGRTALWREDYSDAPGERGLALFDQEKLDRIILSAHMSGMQVAVHAVGDGAIDMCLASFERAQERHPQNLRHLLLHAQTADGVQLDRMRRLRLGAVIRPDFIPSGHAMTAKRLGPDRTARICRWRTMLRGGGVISSGSGAPAGSLSPLDGIHAAVNRSTASGAGDLSERLSIAEAIGTYTWSAAWNGHNEKRRGEIAQGRDADIVVLDEDPFTVNPGDLADIGVAMTVCGGCITHISGLDG